MNKKSIYLIEGILIGIGFIVSLISLILGFNALPTYVLLMKGCLLLAYLFMIYYVIKSYKVPHGNSLKWIYLGYALILMFIPLGQILVGEVDLFTMIPLALCAILIYLLSNMLNNIKLNLIISPIILAVLVFVGVYQVFNKTFYFSSQAAILFAYIDLFNIALAFICLVLSYATRYKEHIEAGKKA